MSSVSKWYWSVYELIINRSPEKHNSSGIAICQFFFDIERVQKHQINIWGIVLGLCKKLKNDVILKQ